MSSISEARELKRRINLAIGDLLHSSNENDIVITENDIMATRDAIVKILVIIRRDIDGQIEEWDAARGIDRPL